MFDWIKNNPIIFLLIFIAIAAPGLFVGAMQAIFYIFLGIIILLVVLALIFRVKIGRIQRDMEDKFRQGQGGNSQGWSGGYSRSSSHSEDDVKVFKQRGVGEKKVAKDVGDYVDFEEVKEKK